MRPIIQRRIDEPAAVGRSRHYCWLILLMVLCVSCGASPRAQQENWFLREGNFVVLSAASDVRYSSGANPSVTYRLTERHPAEKTLSEFDTRFARAGWMPLAKDVFNPDDRGLMRRWGIVVVGDEPRLRWVGQWVSSDGSVVSVSLTYGTESVAAELRATPPLEVYAVWASRERMDMLRMIDDAKR